MPEARVPALRRLVLAPPPGTAPLVLTALVAAAAALSLVHPSAPLAPALVAAPLAGLWLGRLGRLLVPALLGVAAVAPLLLDLPAGGDPLVRTAATALVVALAAALAAGLVAHAAEIAALARTDAVQAALARENEVRAAQHSQQELTGQLHYWATHDALTGLLNRTALVQLVDGTLGAGHAVAVLVVRLAAFADVNEQHGARFGDTVLVQVAQRLSGAARGGDQVARVGGDSFAVLLPGLLEPDAATVAARLTAPLGEPVAEGDHVAQVHIRSAVVVLQPGAPMTAQDALRAAERAARTATVGRAPSVVAGTPAPAAVEDGLTEADLARGIEAGELFLLYQPLVSGESGEITAVEALVRWQHPQQGLVPPDAFIGLAERTGLILPLGLRVLELACAQLAQWRATAPHLTVAVNVSARQLLEPGFVEDVRRVLWGSRVDPAKVVLELTESLLVDDSEAAVATLWQLRGLGVRLALDDFGTGYSSLGRLGDLPLDEMKIDKSFVDRLGTAPRDSAALVTAAIAMGHGLGLEVVAEGVETVAQAGFLRDAGCDLLQGYLLGKPQRAPEVTAQLGQRLLPAAGAVPVPRADSDRVVVPGVLPSMDRR